MTHEEFRWARMDLELSVSEAGIIFGVSADTIRRRWEAPPGGKHSGDVPAPAAQLMRLLQALTEDQWAFLLD